MAWCSASASALRNPSGVQSQPDATGFIPATRLPATTKAAHNAAAIRVLPTPVSVPVTNSRKVPSPAMPQAPRRAASWRLRSANDTWVSAPPCRGAAIAGAQA